MTETATWAFWINALGFFHSGATNADRPIICLEFGILIIGIYL